MNADHELERRLTDFYATEAPQRAPDRVLETALATIDTTRQRRALLHVPWRSPNMNGFARYAIAAVAVIAIGAVGLAVLQPGTGPGVGSPAPSPTASPTPTPSPTPNPREGIATGFRQPFAYILPGAAEFDFGGSNGPTYFELRVPAFADAGMPSGVIVQAIGGGRADPCAASSVTLPIAAGPRAVIDYLKTIPDLDVAGESTTTVGGLPALQAAVNVAPEKPTCAELWPWAASPDSEPLPRAPEGSVLRIMAVDVEGEHIVLTVYGEAGNPAWDTMADELIGSFRFLPAPSSASPGPS